MAAERSNEDVQIPADVYMFSGCKDSQTSADVHDTSMFGLEEGTAAEGAGGACTSAFIKALQEKRECTWIELLDSMRTILRRRAMTQVSQLSSSKPLEMNAQFNLMNPAPSDRRRAVLVGINYIGQDGELKGCHNDVETMSRLLLDEGYKEEDMKVLLDDEVHENPTKEAIEAAMGWLVEGAAAGDSLFFHYSGHGASIEDDGGDEKDGKDEALCPVDYQSAGLIRDDGVFLRLVNPLVAGVQLTCLMDCCHSGSILDLPYMFTADDASVEAVQNGSMVTMPSNPSFDTATLLKFIQDNPALVNTAFDYAEEYGEQIGGAKATTIFSCLRSIIKALAQKPAPRETE